jgi:hypothetical protein
MHRGKILAEGSVDDMKGQHGGGDLEDAFFALIRAQETVEASV